jgi:hypothetical protein
MKEKQANCLLRGIHASLLGGFLAFLRNGNTNRCVFVLSFFDVRG